MGCTAGAWRLYPSSVDNASGWKDMAANAEQWMVEVEDFVKFCTA